jgi:AcrR family transcriptional regulator
MGGTSSKLTRQLTGRYTIARPALVAPRRNDENLREKILAAASSLIAERGYHAVRVADIAQSAGTSTGTVHYHFAAKEDVLTEALTYYVRRAFDRQSAELRRVDDARERLLLLFELQLPVEGQVRDEWSTWLQYWAEAMLRPELRPIHDEFYARWRDTIVRIVERGRRQGVFREVDPEAVARHLTALTDGAAIQALMHVDGMGVEHMRRLLLDYVDSQLAAVPA